jgi:glycosyltransferase involved in cell wall biosynthesis
MKVLNLASNAPQGRGLASYLEMLSLALQQLNIPFETWITKSPTGHKISHVMNALEIESLVTEIKKANPTHVLTHRPLEPAFYVPLKDQIYHVIHDIGLTCLGARYKLGHPCFKPLDAACLMHVLTTKCASRRMHNTLKNFKFLKNFEATINQLQIPLITTSQFLKNFHQEYRYPKHRYHVLEPYISPVTAETSKLSQPLPEKFILYVGSIMGFKGIWNIVEALTQTTSQIPLLICGEGYDEVHLKKKIAKHGLESRIFLLGRKTAAELAYYYSRCQFFIMPSVGFEGFGIVGIEALSHGKPVIGSNQGGIPEWLKDGEHGYLIPAGDSLALAAKIDLLANNSELCKKLGQQGQKYVEATYNLIKFKEKLSLALHAPR